MLDRSSVLHSPRRRRRRRLSRRARKVATALLALFGVQLWLVFGHGYYGTSLQHKLLLSAFGLSLLVQLVPGTSQRGRVLEALASPSPRTRFLISLVVAVAMTAFVILIARWQGRSFQPQYHDEHSYLIQAQLVARGKLWLPAHPLADFFDSFELISQPVYALMYFPGAAAMFAPLVWLHLPFWVMPAVIAGLVAGFVFRIVTELLDAIAGAVAVVMLASTTTYRLLAIMAMSGMPLVLLGLAGTWAWLRWRRRANPVWAAAIGAFLGWAAITRPLDALCFAIPIGLAMLLRFSRTTPRRAAASALALIVGAAPFLAVQAVFNHAVTGRWTRMVFDEYAGRDYPQSGYGFHPFDPTRRPLSTLPQKQAHYDRFTVPAVREHQWRSVPTALGKTIIPQTLSYALPHQMLIMLVPVGLLVMRPRGRWVMAGVLPVFVLLYAGYAFFLPHYTITAVPAAILCVLLGVHAIRRAWPRAAAFSATFLTLAILTLSITEIPGISRLNRDDPFGRPELEHINGVLATLPPHERAIVLFRFAESNNAEEEPVYNIDVAWPDDARIIHAHDLGPRNVELFRYYAQRQPDRVIYLYDRGTGQLTRLGTARDLGAPGN
jgi:4-amino-4-deoxy-L-arabinose transferase-like glycosyltransferase